MLFRTPTKVVTDYINEEGVEGGCMLDLAPFGLATYKMQGDVWNNEEGDDEKIKDLETAAASWLRRHQILRSSEFCPYVSVEHLSLVLSITMDGNKDEAVKCIGIAKEAISAGNKERALKFISIAQRLNHNLCVDDLLAACKNLDSANSGPSNGTNHVTSKPVNPEQIKDMNREPSYTEEHAQVVRKIKRNSDYYEILGVGKSCSVEEVKKAYRKLSLKVHPDKNKAPGSEEAFKKVSKAFKCLSDDNSRRQYDQTGLVEGDEYSQQYNGMRQRRTGHNVFDDNFDADEIFRSFFGQGDMFRTAHVYRTRQAAAGGQPTGADGGDGSNGPNLMLLLQLLPALLPCGNAEAFMEQKFANSPL
ncbi:hypothetical protein E3N88_26836 [Mikania micrantha]|uniref:J domain-containing protein n=1 Tax=Mikania micrantha TaxID=192012 RepID=A0A5N6MXN2_9ASTR|nr:hypothetical protein E3N88_26836 [Mikania micrantha]